MRKILDPIPCDLTGATYQSKRGPFAGQQITVLGLDPLNAGVRRVIVQSEDGRQWGCEEEEVALTVYIQRLEACVDAAADYFWGRSDKRAYDDFQERHAILQTNRGIFDEWNERVEVGVA